METVVQPLSDQQDEPKLLTAWDVDLRQEGRAGVASIALHVAAAVGLLLLPRGTLLPEPPPHGRQVITPLVAPMTQPEPNKAPLSNEIRAEAVLPQPALRIPPARMSTTRPAAMQPGQPAPPAPIVMPEPPKLEMAQNLTKAPELNQPAAQAPAPPPQIQTVEKPAITLPPQAPPQPQPPRLSPGTSSVNDAIRAIARGGVSGGITVGDLEATGIGGMGPGINLPPTRGGPKALIELLSDPQGVDFRPYLAGVLAAVKRNWWAVWPESARMGRRGRVSIQFSVAKNGSVPKMVVVSPSGADALDQAAVSGISMSNPFPPLPAEFKGEIVRFQLNFAYSGQR